MTTATTDKTALVRDAFGAQARGDFSSIQGLICDGALIRVPDFLPLVDLRGFIGLATLVAEMMTRADGGFATVLVDAVGAGDLVTTVNEVTATRAGSTITYNTTWVFRFEGDQIAEAWLHPSLPGERIKAFYGW